MEFWERYRHKLIQKGKLAILSYFCNTFPPTSHIADTFVMDVSLASVSVILRLGGPFMGKRSQGQGGWGTHPLALSQKASGTKNGVKGPLALDLAHTWHDSF